MFFACCSNIGKRESNEDSFCLPYEGVSLAAVADGMGGHNAGEIASKMAIESAQEFIRNQERPEQPEDLLKSAINMANNRIYFYALEHKDCKGMGTTFTGALVGDALTIANVGDSRAYIFSKNSLKQVTKDHSFVQELVESGKIKPESALLHPGRNIITRALGTLPNVRADIYIIPWDKDDLLLLCSDGLNSAVPDEKIAEILALKTDLQKKCENLCQAALEYGGSDNTTVLLVQKSGGTKL